MNLTFMGNYEVGLMNRRYFKWVGVTFYSHVTTFHRGLRNNINSDTRIDKSITIFIKVSPLVAMVQKMALHLDGGLVVILHFQSV